MIFKFIKISFIYITVATIVRYFVLHTSYWRNHKATFCKVDSHILRHWMSNEKLVYSVIEGVVFACINKYTEKLFSLLFVIYENFRSTSCCRNPATRNSCFNHRLVGGVILSYVLVNVCQDCNLRVPRHHGAIVAIINERPV